MYKVVYEPESLVNITEHLLEVRHYTWCFWFTKTPYLCLHRTYSTGRETDINHM